MFQASALERHDGRNPQVNNTSRASRGRRRTAGAVLLLLAGLELGSPRIAAGHDLFTAYVQHRVHLAVGRRHLDLTLDLTFFEEWSARERRAMDADADGRITRSEVETYLKNLAAELPKQVKLRVAGREVPLAPLYDPELDLLGNDQAIPGHHRLHLSFFAPTPAALRADDEIVIEDRLWPEAKALATLQGEGRDGCVLEPEKARDPAFAPLRPDEARVFKVRCLKPPAAEGQAASNALQILQRTVVRTFAACATRHCSRAFLVLPFPPGCGEEGGPGNQPLIPSPPASREAATNADSRLAAMNRGLQNFASGEAEFCRPASRGSWKESTIIHAPVGSRAGVANIGPCIISTLGAFS